MKIVIISISVFLSVSCFAQEVKMGSFEKMYKVLDTLEWVLNFKSNDTIKCNFSIEYLSENGWQEFNNDIFTKVDKTYNYFYFKGTGKHRFSKVIDFDIPDEVIVGQKKVRICCNFQPMRYDPGTYFYKTSYSNSFMIASGPR